MKLKINFKLFMFILLVVPYIKPNYVVQINILNKIYNVLQVLNFFIILIIFIKNNMKISKEIMIIFLLQSVLIVSTIVHNGEIVEIIINTVQIFAFSMIIEYLMKKDVKTFFKAITIILVLLVSCNLATILCKPEGFMVGYLKEWLFGTKNNHFSIVLPTLSISYIYFKYIKQNKYNIMYIILSVISILTIFIMNSATSIVSIIFFYMYFVFINKKKNKIDMRKLTIVYIIIFIGVIVFQIQNNFSFIIENLLHKDLTFTGRTDIWSRAIRFIEKSPIIGYGNESNLVRTFKFSSKSSVHCHNMILETFYQGGILGGILFASFIGIVINKINKINNIKAYNFIVWTILTYFVALFTEVYSFEVIMWVFIILGNLNNIDAIQKKGELNERRIN